MMNSKNDNPRLWRAGTLAEACGVSTDTLRHYERKGLLRPKRSRNGYREYPQHALERVRTIRQALAVGFTLDELARIFRVFDGGGAPCHEVRALAATKLAEIEAHLWEVTRMRDDLRRALVDWDLRLAKIKRGERANLLKTLATSQSIRQSKIILSKPKGKRKLKEVE